MAKRKEVGLECGCTVRVPPSVIDQWLDQPKITLVHCGAHGPQNIEWADGPDALAELFRL